PRHRAAEQRDELAAFHAGRGLPPPDWFLPKRFPCSQPLVVVLRGLDRAITRRPCTGSPHSKRGIIGSVITSMRPPLRESVARMRHWGKIAQSAPACSSDRRCPQLSAQA